jgi:2-methylcitrate dehydratase
MHLANRLAEYAAKLRYEQLDSATVHEVRRRLIDSLACALGAYDAGAPTVARRVASRVTCQPGASFLGGRNKTVAPLAQCSN